MPFFKTKNTPWDNVRKDYETTDISLRFLAARWGIASEGNIRRKRDQEGWTKNLGAITANLVTDGIAAGHSAPNAPISSQHPEDAKKSHRPSTYVETGLQDPNMGAPYQITCPGRVSHPVGNPAPSIAERRELAAQQRDHEERATLKTAKSLATIHSEAIREQAAMGDEMKAMGQAMLLRINVVMLTEDPEERKAAQRGLLSINPDKDSLAGLMKAARQLIESGTMMKRRALGMDVLTKPADGPASTSVLTQPMEAVMREMPLEALMQLRNAVERISKLPSPKQLMT